MSNPRLLVLLVPLVLLLGVSPPSAQEPPQACPPPGAGRGNLEFLGAVPVDRFPKLQQREGITLPTAAFAVFGHASCRGLLDGAKALDLVVRWVDLLDIEPHGSISLGEGGGMDAFARVDLYCPGQDLAQQGVILVSSSRSGCVYFTSYVMTRSGGDWNVRSPASGNDALQLPACSSCRLAGFLRHDGQVWATAFSLDGGVNVVVLDLAGKLVYQAETWGGPFVVTEDRGTALYLVSRDKVSASDRQIVPWDSVSPRWDELSREYEALALRRVDFEGNHILSSVVYRKPATEHDKMPENTAPLTKEAEELFRSFISEGKVVSE